MTPEQSLRACAARLAREVKRPTKRTPVTTSADMTFGFMLESGENIEVTLKWATICAMTEETLTDYLIEEVKRQ